LLGANVKCLNKLPSNYSGILNEDEFTIRSELLGLCGAP